ncbi:sulfite exporter TauE/SafE family protein [Pseudonocardia sp. RS11V-5]|uniref:sulfite exporter TauE/SafE family protein n=1 Tax=Pseudonocardia terrae TaxID=2905831 RepID=UPI001E476D8F|nr:sulfite exporter TauE/SafE family protein [Pseudonocardia terrae]MCE3551809.1 sulfite exporter TauE/SafE family protein [Pseudonocardia terrae]
MRRSSRGGGEETGSRGRIAGIAGIGLLGGVIGGLLGGGSGVLFVPALVRFTTMSRARVHGTSTIANIGVCVAGAAVYAFAGGAIDLRVGTGMLIGGTLGGVLGPRLLARASDTLLRVLLVAVLILTGAEFVVDAVGPPLFTHALVPAGVLAGLWFVVPMSVVVGFVIGAWNGALGLGGGLLAVPALVLLFGVELHVAAGTSLLMFVPNTIVGSMVHLRQGTASVRWGWLLGLTAAPGVVAGALLGLALNVTALSLVFGAFALVMAALESIGLLRARRARFDAADGS